MRLTYGLPRDEFPWILPVFSCVDLLEFGLTPPFWRLKPAVIDWLAEFGMEFRVDDVFGIVLSFRSDADALMFVMRWS